MRKAKSTTIICRQREEIIYRLCLSMSAAKQTIDGISPPDKVLRPTVSIGVHYDQIREIDPHQLTH